MERRARRQGQGLTEYVIVVGLVAMLLVGGVKGLGAAVDRSYGEVTRSVEGIATNIRSGQSERAPWSARPTTPAPAGGASRSRSMRVQDCLHPAFDAAGACTSCGDGP
ncbi:MAG: hypothetical protein KF878_29570 [Planctomycetes bacterium]|nr:hypothetical protein [Planctomycetota bacterium]